MNIITKGDVKKFLALLNSGLTAGKNKELENYSSSSFENPNEYYVSLKFSFRVDKKQIEEILSQDSVDEEIKDMLNNLNK